MNTILYNYRIVLATNG